MVFITSEGKKRKVGSTSSVVEINGNQYDAYSGQLIKAGKKTKEQVKYHTSRVIDGFIKGSASRAAKKQPVQKTEVITETTIAKKSAPKISSRFVGSAKSLHRRTEKSRTLMREAVAKPVTFARKSISNNFSDTSSLKPSSEERASRARTVVKHAKVRRFGSAEVEPDHPREAVKSKSSSVSAKRPPTVSLSLSAGGTAAITSMPAAGLSHQRLERMLDRALTQADAHKQKFGKNSKGNLWHRVKQTPKWISIVSLVLIAAILILFFAWQSIPQVALKVASLQSHVDASLPSYTPSGFNYAGHMQAQTGTVTIPYQASGNASKTYTVTEQSSAQDTSSLVANNTDPSQQVQTSQADGVPIVIVGNKGATFSNKAMCVNNGIQTTVKNLANLAPDELLNIAKSVCAN